MLGLVHLAALLIRVPGAKALLSEQVPPELAPVITSFRVDPDVSLLGGSEPVQAETEVGQDGKIQKVIKRWASDGVSSIASMELRASSGPRGMELHSLQTVSPAEATPGDLEVKKTDVSSNKVTGPRTVCSSFTPHYPALNRMNPHALACGSMREGRANKWLNMPFQRSGSSPILKGNRSGRAAGVACEATSSCESPYQRKITALGG